MASFPTPAQIEAAYFQILKSLKPQLNVNDANSDFVIRGKAFAGLVSGLYGDQAKINADTFITTARAEALALKGSDLGIERQPATAAQCPQVRITGTNGTVVAPGAINLLYAPTGIAYVNTTGGTITGGGLTVAVLCQAPGQAGNIRAPDTLQVVSPPSGVNQAASLLVDMADGADEETDDSYRARLLARERAAPAGGNQTDYPQFAFDADSTVRSAFIKRFGRGLGTVDVYITTGTTDIDTAVTQGQPVVRIPSSGTIAAVQAYYDAHVPLTDCPAVYAPMEVIVPVTVNVVLAQGLTLLSVPADPTYNPLGLTCAQLIEREISRVLYKLPVGGRSLPGLPNGYVVAADIEEGLDEWLSAVPTTAGGTVGKLPILADRQIQKLDGSNYDLMLLSNQLAAPGAVSVVLGV